MLVAITPGFILLQIKSSFIIVFVPVAVAFAAVVVLLLFLNIITIIIDYKLIIIVVIVVALINITIVFVVRFLKDLRKTAISVMERNLLRKYPYDYLNPGSSKN